MSCIISSFVILLSPTSRTKKVVHKATTTYDKRLQSTFNRVGVNTIPAVEEVNFFKDYLVIQFSNPKGIATFPSNRNFIQGKKSVFICLTFFFSFGQASIGVNNWVVSCAPQTKSKFFIHICRITNACTMHLSSLKYKSLIRMHHKHYELECYKL